MIGMLTETDTRAVDIGDGLADEIGYLQPNLGDADADTSAEGHDH